MLISEDEQPGLAKIDKIPLLKPAFKEEGTVTAANSSSISDGAAALVLCSREKAFKASLKVRARVVGHAAFAAAPSWFTTAPVYASQKLLELIGWNKNQVDLWEFNEAFDVVALAFMKELGISSETLSYKHIKLPTKA